MSAVGERPAPRLRSIVLTLALACLVVPVLAACTAVEARDDNRLTVEMTDLRQFDPASLRVPLGVTVVWKNESLVSHTATAEPRSLPTGAEPWDSGALYSGQTWAYHFEVPGTYVYVCRYHEDEGMVGTIVVGA
ncbi:MAG: cupredoxin domain-containing protein [Chloroflexi bacterium]|nr:cupredoxin domain-containing protein [Chloroflexota bacterium]